MSTDNTKHERSLSCDLENRLRLSETVEQREERLQKRRGADRRDSELRIRTKRNVSERVGEYTMLNGEARKLLRVQKIDFRQGEFMMLKGEMNLIRQSTPFTETF